jgi:hypothetical protein
MLPLPQSPAKPQNKTDRIETRKKGNQDIRNQGVEYQENREIRMEFCYPSVLLRW